MAIFDYGVEIYSYNGGFRNRRTYRHNLLGTFIAQCILPHFSYSGEQYCLEVSVLIYCDRI